MFICSSTEMIFAYACNARPTNAFGSPMQSPILCCRKSVSLSHKQIIYEEKMTFATRTQIPVWCAIHDSRLAPRDRRDWQSACSLPPRSRSLRSGPTPRPPASVSPPTFFSSKNIQDKCIQNARAILIWSILEIKKQQFPTRTLHSFNSFSTKSQFSVTIMDEAGSFVVAAPLGTAIRESLRPRRWKSAWKRFSYAQAMKPNCCDLTGSALGKDKTGFNTGNCVKSFFRAFTDGRKILT